MYHDSAFYKSTLQNFINMTHQNTLKEINNKLSELTHRFEKISSSNEIHLIDVDILLEMMRELYLKTNLLKEPVKTDEITIAPEPIRLVPPIPMIETEIEPDFVPHSIPNIPESVSTHELFMKVEPLEEADPKEDSPYFSQSNHYEDLPKSLETREIETAHPLREITQSQPEVLFPQPEIVNQEAEIVQPRAEYPPEEPEVVQPPIPEPFYPPVAPPPSYYPPKPAVHQSDLFGSGSLSDKYKTEAPSLNDKITTRKPDHTLADKMNLVPISDIKSAIGINEKFQFINELFDGSPQVYNEAIALLNNCTGSDSAHAVFRDFQARYNWDSENAVFLKFREYLERRYLNS